MFATRTWNPLFDLANLQREMNRLFERPTDRPEATPTAAWPPVNVYRGPEGVAFTVHLPGYEPDQVEVTSTRTSLSIRGNRTQDELDEGQVRSQNERHFGEFFRTFELPFEIDPSKIDATFNNGVLLVSLGRPQHEQPRQVEIKLA